jgi:hypothetical protein
MHVEPTLLFRFYDDVSITGGSIATAVGTPTAPSDQGKLFAAATGRVNVGLTNSLSAFIEGDLRGTSGVFGAGVNGGLRYNLN